MNEDNLKRIFSEFLSDGKFIPADAIKTMGQLIRLTLEFRDRLKADTGEIVTVDDTHQALNAYITANKTQSVPDGLNARSEGLLRLWLKEINGVDY
jgi:hypothetical protein